nr:helix-turn-helix domain-containing protein [Aequorivita sp. S2608]
MEDLIKKGKAGKTSRFNRKQKANITNMSLRLYSKLLEDENELLTEADMMRIFCVCRATLYRWRQKKHLPHLKMGRSVFYLKRVICNILLTKSGYFNSG